MCQSKSSIFEIYKLDNNFNLSLNLEIWFIASQDMGTLVLVIKYKYHPRNLIGRYIAWNWIRDNWDRLSSYYDTAISSRWALIGQ